jgi:hypothetical protein
METAPVAPSETAPVSSAPAAGSPEVDKIKDSIPELMKQLMRDVTDDEAAGEVKKKEPAPPADSNAKPEGEKSADKKPAAPVEEPIKLRRQKKERPALPVVDDTPPPPAAPAARPAAEVAAESGKKWEEGLEENEREMLEDARILEKVNPAKKGLAAKTEKFIRDHIAFTQRADFDENDPEYKQFLEANAPKLTRTEIRAIEENRIAENLRRENDSKFADLHYRSFVKEKEPEIDRIGQQVHSELVNNQLPDDLAKILRENIAKHGGPKGYEEAKKTHLLEIETAEAILAAAADDIKEFHRLNTVDPQTGRTMVEFASSPSSPKYEQHKRLGDMVANICEAFKNSAGEEAIRDGKWFVTRNEWLRLKPEARGRFWTFSNKEIIDRAKAGIKGAITGAIEQKWAYLKARGLTRQQAQAAAAAQPPKPTPRTPPAPAPVPAGGDEGQPVSEGAKLAAAFNRD